MPSTRRLRAEAAFRFAGRKLTLADLQKRERRANARAAWGCECRPWKPRGNAATLLSIAAWMRRHGHKTSARSNADSARLTRSANIARGTWPRLP